MLAGGRGSRGGDQTHRGRRRWRPHRPAHRRSGRPCCWCTAAWARRQLAAGRDRLAGRFRVTAMDRRGRGTSGDADAYAWTASTPTWRRWRARWPTSRAARWTWWPQLRRHLRARRGRARRPVPAPGAVRAARAADGAGRVGGPGRRDGGRRPGRPGRALVPDRDHRPDPGRDGGAAGRPGGRDVLPIAAARCRARPARWRRRPGGRGQGVRQPALLLLGPPARRGRARSPASSRALPAAT